MADQPTMKDWKQLNEQFQQAQDQIEALQKSNDVLWKVVAFLMEHI
jgi:prefoldin subunit 5